MCTSQKIKSYFKNKIFYPFLLVLPFAVVGCLNLANQFTELYGININPTGIGNAEWFLFFAAYLGGMFTYIAFKRTVEHSKKTSFFQAKLSKIESEEKVIALVVSSISFRDINDILIRYLNARDLGKLPEQVESNRILDSALERRRELTLQNARLAIETNIYNTDCKNCKQIKQCKLGEIKNQFIANYELLYNDLYNGLSYVYEYINVFSTNINLTNSIFFSEAELSKCDREIERYQLQLHTDSQENFLYGVKQNEELIKLTQEQKIFITERIRSAKEQINKQNEAELSIKVKELNQKIEKIEKEDISRLIILSREYTSESKNRAYQELIGDNC